MGDLKRGAKRALHTVKNVLGDALEGSKQIAEKLGYGVAGLKSNETKDKIAAAIPPVAPVPDLEEQQRARRRRLAGTPRTGRASTILTSDDDTLG